MGRKTNSIALRLKKTNKDFNNCWYADKLYNYNLSKSLFISRFVENTFQNIGLTYPQFSIIGAFKKGDIRIFFLDPEKRKNFAEKNVSNSSFPSPPAKKTQKGILSDLNYTSENFKFSSAKSIFFSRTASGVVKPKDLNFSFNFGTNNDIDQKKLNKEKNPLSFFSLFSPKKNQTGDIPWGRDLKEPKNIKIISLLGGKEKIEPNNPSQRNKCIYIKQDCRVWRSPYGLDISKKREFESAKVLNVIKKKSLLEYLIGDKKLFGEKTAQREKGEGIKTPGLSKHRNHLVKTEKPSFSSKGPEVFDMVDLKPKFPLTGIKKVKKKQIIEKAERNFQKILPLWLKELLVYKPPSNQRTFSSKIKTPNMASLFCSMPSPVSPLSLLYLSQRLENFSASRLESCFSSASILAEPIFLSFDPKEKGGNLSLREGSHRVGPTGFARRAQTKETKTPFRANTKGTNAFSEQIPFINFYSRLSFMWENPFSLFLYQSPNEKSSALFLAKTVSYLLERKVSFRIIKRQLLRILQYSQTKNKRKIISKITGIKIVCSGRVGGRSKKAQRARKEGFMWGQTGLHVFSNPLDFAKAEAFTPFGAIGIQVWISTKQF